LIDVVCSAASMTAHPQGSARSTPANLRIGRSWRQLSINRQTWRRLPPPPYCRLLYQSDFPRCQSDDTEQGRSSYYQARMQKTLAFAGSSSASEVWHEGCIYGLLSCHPCPVADPNPDPKP
jgi:hypothetical protein